MIKQKDLLRQMKDAKVISKKKGNGFSDMRPFPKHEGKKKRPARREHSEMKFLVLQGVFLFYLILQGVFYSILRH